MKPAPLLGTVLLTTLSACAFGFATTPVQDSADALRRRHEEKLARPFVSSSNWTTDHDVARSRAREEQKLIFTYFTRSYAPCVPCKSLEQQVLSTDDFAAFSSAVVPFLHITTHIPETPYDDLLHTNGFRGFPSLGLMDADGELIYRLQPDQMKDVAGFQRALWMTEQHQRLAARADADPAAAQEMAEFESRWRGFRDDGAVVAASAMRTSHAAPRRATKGTYVIRGDLSTALASGDFVIFQPARKGAASGMSAMGMAGANSSSSDSVPGEVARTKLVDGKFTLEGEVDHVHHVYFYVLNAMTEDGRRMAPTKGQGFILEPGEVRLTMNTSHRHKVTGGFFNEGVYGSWQNSDAYQDLQALMPSLFRSVPGETDAEQDARTAIGLEIQKAMMDAETSGRREIALGHPDLLVRQLAIETAWLGGPWMLEGARGILEEDPANAWAQKFVADQEARLAQRERHARAAQVGGRFLPFSAESLDGEPTSLSQTCEQNKYVLLEFWASWCGPCRAEIPHMKKAYAQYHDRGFEIFAYTLDDKRSAWEKASGKEQLPWINTGMGQKSDPVLLYEVTGVPANYLIDGATGKVVARNLRGKALDEKLKELLGAS